jgi:hypothetical protein
MIETQAVCVIGIGADGIIIESVKAVRVMSILFLNASLG